MSADQDTVFQDENDQRQRMDWEDQQLDLERAKDELGDFFTKCEVGMATILDVEGAKENLKLFGVNIT